MVSNQPAQLIGDLSQNAGAFATGQAQHQMGLQDAQFADRLRQGDEEMQLRRDQMAQQADLAKQHIQAQVMAHVLSSMSQQQLQDIRDKARLQQIAAQGGNQQTLAGINNASRQGIASDRNDTTQRGQDLRSGYQYDALDQADNHFNQNQQRQTDQFGQTYDQRNRGLDQRDTAQASTNFYRQEKVNESQNRDTVVGQQQQRLQLDQDLRRLSAEARVLQHAISADPANMNPDTAALRARLNAVARELTAVNAKAKSARLFMTQPPVQTPAQQFQPPPQMGTYAGDETPAYGGGAPMQQPMPQAQGQPVNRDAIRQLVLEGYSNEEIKAMLGGQ